MMRDRKTRQPVGELRFPGRWIRAGALIASIMPAAWAYARDMGGEALADACTSCHGTEGRSQGYIPSIAGVDKATLLRQLKAYRAQTGAATIMNRIARAYTDTELEALAGYFSAASPARAASRPGPASRSDAASRSNPGTRP